LWWLSDWITTTHIFMRKTAMVGGLGREKRGQICTLVVVAKAPKSATQRQGEQGFLGGDGAFWDFWGFFGDAMGLFGAWVRRVTRMFRVARWLGG
jgi:hypothetical protein